MVQSAEVDEPPLPFAIRSSLKATFFLPSRLLLLLRRVQLDTTSEYHV